MQQAGKAVILAVRVLPGARRAGIEGLWNGTHLKIALHAPASEGRANEALIDFLADYCHVRKSAITILSGHAARTKRVQIEGLDAWPPAVGADMSSEV